MTEPKEIQLPWITEAYRIFAAEGPVGLKIERIARAVEKNKSSFYQHFADLEVFSRYLLDYHMRQVEIIAEKESRCTDLECLIAVLVEHKEDLLFNRQLRINREVAEFEKCLLKTNQDTVSAILPLWASILGLENNSYLAGLVLQLSLENFFLQITDKTLTTEWLHGYFGQLKELISQMKQAK